MTTPKIDDLDKPIWGAKAIAEIVHKPLTQVNYLLIKGLLDADKVGRQWVSTPRRLLSQFAGRP
jgi:hypothetical protein